MMKVPNIFRTELLDLASKLDAVVNGCGEITKSASTVVDLQDRDATLHLIEQSSSIIKSSEYSKEVKRLASLCKDSLMRYYGYMHIMEVFTDLDHNDDTLSLSDLQGELDRLIGLNNVKSAVRNLIAYQKVKKLREEQSLYSEKQTMHLAFTGNPGTGKTTVARIIGRIYKQLGLLSKGHFTEVSRTDLIAGYQGQTALKVKRVVERAKGGVLFIDEAYSITENDHSDSYGRECLTELTKALEDYRDDLVVIVAGYTEPMEEFFGSNPGLKSRFNTFIEFSDFSGEELVEIFESICRKNNYILSKSASNLINKELFHLVEKKQEHFANGRLVRNIFESVVMNHALRVSQIENPTKMQLEQINEDDVIPVLSRNYNVNSIVNSD